MSKELRPHPLHLFAEFHSDLGFVLHDIRDLLSWLSETRGKRRQHLSRLAIVYLAFAAQAAIDLRASAGHMNKKYQDFVGSDPAKTPWRALERGRTKRLVGIAKRWKAIRNLIAHPYRIEVDGRARPMTFSHGLALHFATGATKQLGSDYKEVEAAVNELRDWFDEAFSKGGLDNDWLGGGEFQTDF